VATDDLCACPAVSLDGKRLRMGPDEYEQEHVMAIKGTGELMLLLQKHRPGIGQACELVTGAPCCNAKSLLLQSRTPHPAGLRDVACAVSALPIADLCDQQHGQR
jgi:hypothetical protein